MTDATKVPIEPGVIARAIAGVKYTLTGQSQSWMGPGAPATPIVPAPAPADARIWDFQPGRNLQITPRGYEAVSFTQLRQLADAYDLLRLLIETRKDQMEKLEWTITTRDGQDLPAATDAMLRTLLERPDRKRDWGEWLRALMEDVFVVDAPSISIQRTRGGDLYALRLIAGDTITIKIDDLGDIPDPPLPAYQQVIKGVPYANFTTDELCYQPRNRRTGRLYGFSPVEQIVMTVNIALRRQVGQLGYYTEGNIPAVLLSVPDGWNAEQIAKFQKNWDAMFSTDQGVLNRQRAKFIPNGTKPEFLQKEKLFDDGDAWLARVCCYALSLPPTPFINQVNRATAESAQEAALQEGLAPYMSYVARLMTRLIRDYAGIVDAKFAWKQEEEISPEAQATVDKIYLDAGVRTPKQVADKHGWEYEEPPPEPTPVALPVGAVGAVQPGGVPPLPPGEAKKLLKRLRASRGQAY